MSTLENVKDEVVSGAKSAWKKVVLAVGGVVLAGGVFFSTCGTPATDPTSAKPDAAFIVPADAAAVEPAAPAPATVAPAAVDAAASTEAPAVAK